MKRIKLDDTQLDNIKTGEAFSLTAVMAILAIGLVIIIMYKLFTSQNGEAAIPGGFEFEWN